MSAMANRTVLVDNNTWNNTHIATVGKRGIEARLISSVVRTVCPTYFSSI